MAKAMLFLILLASLFAVTSCSDASPSAFDVGYIPSGPLAAWGGCPDADDAPPMPTDLPSSSPTAAAGTIAGTFSVSSTGDASYSMPLPVVPGRAGLQPELAIRYDSSAGEGVLGMGFSIAGLSSITRCPKTVAQDGEIQPIFDKLSDALCLDDKRLIQVNPESLKPIELRTFPDTFSKVVASYAEAEGWEIHHGAKSFEVFTKDGLILEYGGEDTSRIIAKNGAVRSWLLSRVRDRSGNTIDFQYINTRHPTDGYTVEHAPSRIEYTGHIGDPVIPASRAVVFEYLNKEAADVRLLFARGMELRRSLRLGRIRMLGETSVLNPNGPAVREYYFSYGTGPATKRMLLQSVTECASNGICKPPTRFTYKTGGSPGFTEVETPIPAPQSDLATMMLTDITGDGLDDIVFPDVEVIGGQELPITDWLVAPNKSHHVTPTFFDALEFAHQENFLVAKEPIQPEFGVPIDYDHNGRMDILIHDIQGAFNNFRVLLAQPDHTLVMLDTEVKRHYPPDFYLGPHLPTAHDSFHVADVSGDGMADLIQCGHDTIEPVWRLHLWKPEVPGFDKDGSAIHALTARPCDAEVHTVDMDADGRVELLVQKAVAGAPGAKLEALRYEIASGAWSFFDTNLRVTPQGGRILFLDVNGDALPDAVVAGLGELFTFINRGDSFSEEGKKSLTEILPEVDAFAKLATVLDFNGDGKQDILMPLLVAGGKPAWRILQSTGSASDGTFTLVDPGLPFEALFLNEGVTLADARGPRVTDVDGNGAQDVLLNIGGFVHVFKNKLADEDMLASVTDGLHAFDPGEPGFRPNISINYDHLIDFDRTVSSALGFWREGWTYLPHSDADAASEECAYPVRCVVGPRRVVESYSVTSGWDKERSFKVAYRDARYHRLGRGFLGFGKRIVRDVDTGSGTAEFYDNVTFDEALRVFPFAGKVAHEWRWNPTLDREMRDVEGLIELRYTDILHETVPTLGGRSYFTLPVSQRQLREQGVILTCDPLFVEEFVAEKAQEPATVLSDSSRVVLDHDLYGNVLKESAKAEGAEGNLEVVRTFENDESTWLLGRMTGETACSSTSTLTQCRVFSRSYDEAGRIKTESASDGEGDPETSWSIKLKRDAFGNVTLTTEQDAFGDVRNACTTYDEAGIFPVGHRNPAGHIQWVKHDADFGVLKAAIDANGLVRRWAFDTFGRLTEERTPNNAAIKYIRSRSKDGGPQKNAWSLKVRTVVDGGEDETIELDPLGRQVRSWKQGVATGLQEPPRIVQEVEFDELGEHVARRSVPYAEGTSPGLVTYDEWRYDTMGRPIEHIAPWGAATKYRYIERTTEITGPGGGVTRIEDDPMGRPVSITDPEQGVTSYTYGPFGGLWTVTDPGQATTTTERDAFGRVRVHKDPDRGTTVMHYDGFGQLTSSDDAAGRHVVFTYDPLGRRLSREDDDDEITSWQWDVAANGIGQLASVTSPGGHTVSYGYDSYSRLQTIKLTVENETFTTGISYDASNRPVKIGYPAGAGTGPFVVENLYDAHGHLLTVQDALTQKVYWTLKATDGAGRITAEKFGNGALTTRAYYDAKNRTRSISTKAGGATVQSLSYAYDDRLNLTRRTDARQGKSEYLGYDLLDRLTSSYLSPGNERVEKYTYEPNGNLLSKAGVGTYTYDPAHPHAVEFAGSAKHAYDAVGNQTERPGATIAYTAFDLPKSFTLEGNAGSVELDYDGLERRIRKRTAAVDTVYVGDLYERVTNKESGAVEHRYYVYSSERLVATVTRNVASPSVTQFVHVDHLGSVDALTDETGAVVERRSYDAFGAPRNPVWGGPPLLKSPTMPRGFTGHEGDEELGLVNMKGRLYDPKIGRFLTPDPVVAQPFFGQSWNAYTYTRNNPLAYVDPTGFTEEEPEEEPFKGIPAWSMSYVAPDGVHEILVFLPEDGEERAGAGVFVAPIDTAVWGNSAGYVPPPLPTRTEEPSLGRKIDETATGALVGISEYVFGIGTSISLGIVTGGQFTIYEMLAAFANGYMEDGALGAVNAFNPFYQIARGGIEAHRRAEKGDYFGAGRTGAKAGATLVMTVAAIVGGIGSLAGKSGPAAAAETGAVEAGAGSGAAARGGSYGGLKTAGANDAHHVIQDAAVRELPGYSRSAAPAVELPGPSTRTGSPHYEATQVQRQPGGGNYAAERRIGYKALRRGGLTPDEARRHIELADDYFSSIGVTPTTPTRIPGNR